MIEKLRVRIPAGAAVEFSSPEITLCADSYSGSVIPPCYRSGMQKTPVIFQNCRRHVITEHAHTLDQTKSELAGYAAVQA